MSSKKINPLRFTPFRFVLLGLIWKIMKNQLLVLILLFSVLQKIIMEKDCKEGVLQDVRVVIHKNFFDIEVNCFNEKYDKSIYRIFIDILFELYLNDLIIVKRVKNLKSLYSRLYYIARHFFSASVDFRFDWNREQVIPVLNECRKITKCTNIYKNTVYLTEKNNRNYRIKIYDKKKDMERILEGIYYPIRLEVTIKGFNSIPEY